MSDFTETANFTAGAVSYTGPDISGNYTIEGVTKSGEDWYKDYVYETYVLRDASGTPTEAANNATYAKCFKREAHARWLGRKANVLNWARNKYGEAARNAIEDIMLPDGSDPG